MAWAWVKPETRREVRSYVKIRPTGLYISIRSEEIPWPRERVRVIVGFEPGRMAIRIDPDGRVFNYGFTPGRWSGGVTWAGLDTVARQYNLPVGVPIPAYYDPKQDLIVAEADDVDC